MAPSSSAFQATPAAGVASEPQIEHVSDTAVWVATYRALETERPDALFRDPLASVLVGERGRRLAAAMPHGKLMAWVMAVRTVSIDRLVLDALADGVDCVLNLGAGLDTRPYRMALPPALRWVEVDFPQMVAFKDAALADEKPACALERIPLDLSDRDARRALFARLGSEAKRVLVITEGVILYLTNEEAGSLAEDLAAVPQFEAWIQDFHLGPMRNRLPRGWAKKLKAAPFRFDGTGWFDFFRQRGWEANTTLYAPEEGMRLGRRPPLLFPRALLFWLMPRSALEKMRKFSGYVRLKRTSRPVAG